jgi:hypothetical protein
MERLLYVGIGRLLLLGDRTAEFFRPAYQFCEGFSLHVVHDLTAHCLLRHIGKEGKPKKASHPQARGEWIELVAVEAFRQGLDRQIGGWSNTSPKMIAMAEVGIPAARNAPAPGRCTVPSRCSRLSSSSPPGITPAIPPGSRSGKSHRSGPPRRWRRWVPRVPE